jgi:hypothetical protein
MRSYKFQLTLLITTGRRRTNWSNVSARENPIITTAIIPNKRLFLLWFIAVYPSLILNMSI